MNPHRPRKMVKTKKNHLWGHQPGPEDYMTSGLQLSQRRPRQIGR